ncbi:MAG TPA: hypothetical protein V6D12_00255 [Candidatus Obscuribacterales bacterium]
MTPKCKYSSLYVDKLHRKIERLESDRLELIAELRRLGDENLYLRSRLAQYKPSSIEDREAWRQIFQQVTR